ncbi:hypothetical protein [Shewanella acanthi]|uniref:hypothetical protein n=1 Tax=Shewanella acanthi TaxID=2864212 RepID=UPI001C65F97B|nr:hypothetical protein [Shewanella acanthi]QYJ77935.1 hypothetical protein K0H61_12500 [Shewanella acanthi]
MHIEDNNVDQLNFIDSLTMHSARWCENYLLKRGVPLNNINEDMSELKSQLKAYIDPQNVAHVRLIQRFRNAWRTRQSRRKSNSKRPLSVSLEPDVIKKLTEMSKGFVKSEVVKNLINDNYKNFCYSKEEIEKLKLEIKSEKLKINLQDRVKIENEISFLTEKNKILEENIKNISKITTELFNIIKHSKENNSCISDADFTKANELHKTPTKFNIKTKNKINKI